MADNAGMRPITCLALLLAATTARAQSPNVSDWGHYGGDSFAQRYSPLREINRENVARLEVAWTYRTGELGEGFARADKLAFEATPVLAFGNLYLSTPTSIVIALDPANGKERWRHDPRVPRQRHYAEATSRGVTVWEDPDAARKGACRRRVFLGTLDARLLALDAGTGQPCSDFGSGGSVSLGVDARLTTPGEYLVTSPPATFEDIVIVGAAIGDNRAVELERGIVRGFDARTGALRWKFDPIPDGPDHPAAGQWQPGQAQRTGGANAWAPITVDPGRGLAFIPTGSASPDFYGGERLGTNAMANSLVALDARTGAVRWFRQLIHHDLWDYDLAAQPTLVEIENGDRSVAAVVQATKSGLLFVLDRETGAPVYGITELAHSGIRNWSAYAALIAGVLLLVVFLRRQRRLPIPLLDIQLFSDTRFTAAIVAELVIVFANIGALFFLPIFFRQVGDFSALQSGAALLPESLAGLVTAALTARLIRIWNHRRTLIVGLAAGAAAMLLLGLTIPVSYVAMVFPLVLLGFSFGLVVTTASDLVLTSASADRVGAATGISETAFELGNALAIALTGSAVSVLYLIFRGVPADFSSAMDSHAFTSSLAANCALGGVFLGLVTVVVAWTLRRRQGTGCESIEIS